MLSNNQIHYLTRREINISRWNECIDRADNGIIYAQSSYLDAMCTNWDALVLNDYQMVMPLPWRKKWGFRYIYPPYFIAALGVFGNNLNSSIVSSFLSQIPKCFKYWEIDLNEQNRVDALPKLQLEKRKNIFLSLNQPYEVLYDNYKRLAKRKLGFALKNELTIHRKADPNYVITCYEKYYEQKQRIIPPETYAQLKLLLSILPENNYQSYVVKQQSTIAAFFIVLNDERNVYSLIGGSTEEGKKSGAFYLATDAAVKDFSGTEKNFRFEGSDKKGIAFFNLQFGSSEVDYWRIKMNSLPWPVNYFK